MLRNYLTTGLRNFLRKPFYSIINVSGLVLGLVCSIFIFLWVMDERSYDRYHPDNDRVFKVMWNHNYSDGRITTDPWTSGLLADLLKTEIPEVEQTTRLAWSEVKLFKFGETANYESGNYADQGIFEVLNLTLIEGNKLHALPNSNSVAISRKMATKFFKNESALDKVFHIDNNEELTVTAVFEDIPENATERFEFILPFELYIRKEHSDISTYDGSGWQYTLVKLKEKDKQLFVDEKIKDLINKHEEASASPPPPPFLFPMLDWRLYDSFENAKQSGGRVNYVISFSLTALFILIIACINFMNLATARSVSRAREVGIRKVAGASRSVLIRQFLTESILLSFLSLFIALLLVQLLLPIFNGFTEKNLQINYLDPVVTGSLIGISLFTGIIAGSYPAFFLSSFRPSSVLKGNLQAVFAGADLRRMLVVFQFGLSMIFIVGALVVNNQIDFMRNKNLGFDKNNVLSIRTNQEIFKSYEVFRNEMLQNPLITSVALGDAHPMEINGQGYYDWEGKSSDDDTYFNQAMCDYDYLETLGFTVVKGRNFSRDFPSDSTSYIITEEAANRMGFSNPLGQRLRIEEDGVHEGQVIGVIKDFNNLSIHEASQPTVFALGNEKNDFGRWVTLFVRYEPGKLKESLDHIRSTYKRNAPNFPIQLSFLDQYFEEQFKLELMVATLSSSFTIIAIIISCLGLFGLASFSAERRAKEIGVRKVLGASVNGLVVMLCKDFTRLVIYAIIVGTPVAYYLMEQFLSQYPYRTELNFSMFTIPALALLFVSLSIVSYQSIKAALNNPVEVLRSE